MDIIYMFMGVLSGIILVLFGVLFFVLRKCCNEPDEHESCENCGWINVDKES